LNEPLEPLSGLINSIYNYNGYDISCYGFDDGGINVIPNGGVSPYTFIWDNTQTLNPLPFQSAGMHQLSMYDNNGCPWEGYIVLQQPDELIWNIDVYPDTCEKQVGKVDIQVSGGVPAYIYSWNISQPLPVAVQMPEGEYYIEIEDLNNCVINDTIIITNLVGPEMDFSIMSDFERLYTQLDNPIVFIDMSELAWQNALYWDWDFGDGTYGTDSIAFHSYQEIGEYDVLLQITTDYNCIDTLVKKVVIKEYDLFIPNTFTPNSNDDINKGFRPYGIGIDEFLMKIYTRWGEFIYSTTNIEEEWNGKFNNSGEECQLGVYVYYIEVKDIFGEIHKYEGQVNLIR
jgi:gliding motility-associated-like protein